MASLKCLVSEERTSRPRAPLRPALPRQGGEGVCVAGSPTGLPSPQPTGRDPNARATPSPPLRGNSHLSSPQPVSRSLRASSGRDAHRAARARSGFEEAGRRGALRKWRRPPRAGSHRNRRAHSHGVEPQAHPPSRSRLCSPRVAARGGARPPPPSRRPASGSFPSAARGSSGAGSTAFSQNPAQAQGGELTAASARVGGAQRAGER